MPTHDGCFTLEWKNNNNNNNKKAAYTWLLITTKGRNRLQTPTSTPTQLIQVFPLWVFISLALSLSLLFSPSPSAAHEKVVNLPHWSMQVIFSHFVWEILLFPCTFYECYFVQCFLGPGFWVTKIFRSALCNWNCLKLPKSMQYSLATKGGVVPQLAA